MVIANHKKTLRNAETYRAGFTLIELVIVMGILVIVLGLSMSSMLQSQSVQVFNNTFGKLFSLVNNARSLAITGKGQLDYTDYDRDTKNYLSSPADYVNPANYGVRFDTAAGSVNVRLFADINPPQSSGTGQKGRFDAGGVYTTGDDLVLDSLTLPNKISLAVHDGSSSQATPSIFYGMKYADMTFEGLNVNAGSPFIRIQLTDQQTTTCRQIRIHKLSGIPEVGVCTAS